MIDETESYRRALVPQINALENDQIPEPKWTAQTVGEEFIIHRFAAPFCVVTRKSDHQKGSLEFRHAPRVYFGFEPA